MLIHCPGKRCNTTRDHKLKVESNEVVCMDCGETNNSANEFIKHAMKSSGEVLRSVQARKAFMYRCAKCLVDRSAKIVDEQAVCEVCLQPLNLSAPMVEAVKAATPRVKEELVAPKTEVKGVIRRHNKE